MSPPLKLRRKRILNEVLERLAVFTFCQKATDVLVLGWK